jgi:hypothetical protein
MTIAIVTLDELGRFKTVSCPATELEGLHGSLTLWPRSERPIRIAWAWVYWLRFREVPDA